MKEKNFNKNKLHSEKLQKIMDCLDGEYTAEEILSKVLKNGISLQRPKREIIKSLHLLRIIGVVETEFDGKRRIFRKSELAEKTDINLYTLSKVVEKILEELDNRRNVLEKKEIKSKLSDVDKKDIDKSIEFLENKGIIKTDRKKIIKNITIHMYKK